MKNQASNEQATNEIDLLELLYKIFRVLKKYSLFIIICVILGIGYSIYKFITSEPYYETSMIARSTAGNKTVTELINSLEDPVEERDLNILKNELQIDSATAAAIKKIECINLQEERDYPSFQINLKITRKTAIDSIQNGIETYLSQNQYIQKNIRINREHYQDYLRKTNETLSLIDSLKKSEGTENQNKFYIENQAYATQVINLMDKKKLIINNLEFNEPLIVIKDFYIPANPKKDTIKFLLFYPFSGLLIGVILSFIIFFIRKIQHYK